VRSDEILPLTQIASEVITNAIKYSHVRGETGKLTGRCHSLPGGELEFRKSLTMEPGLPPAS